MLECHYHVVYKVKTLNTLFHPCAVVPVYFRMDSFVLAETFKYLYLLFEEEENLSIDLSQYIFTTEAHILPLSLANHTATAAGSDTAARNKVSDIHFAPNTLVG